MEKTEEDRQRLIREFSLTDTNSADNQPPSILLSSVDIERTAAAYPRAAVVRQPDPRDETETGPSSCSLESATVMSVVSIIFCGIFFGVAALALIIKARSRLKTMELSRAADLVVYAWVLISISIFLAFPVYAFLALRFIGHRAQ